MLYFSAFFTRWVGSWFGGTGSGEGIRTAIVWGGCIPGLQFAIAFIILVFVGNTLLSGANLGQTVGIIFTGLYIVFGLWIWIISLKAIAEAHRFSSLKAFLTQITIGVIFTVPFLLFGLLFW